MESVSYREILGFFWRFMRLQKWVFFAILLIDCLAWPLDVLVWPYILRVVLDIFTRFEGDRMAAWEVLKSPIIAALCFVIYVETVSRVMGFLMAKALPKLQADIRMEMFDHIQHHSPRYFNERFAGNLANKMIDMTSQVEAILQQLFFPILPAIATCILGSVFLWFVNPIFSLILLFWTILHLAVCVKYTRSADEYERRHGEARSTLLGKIIDSLTNNFAVNLFYRFSYEKKMITPYQMDEKRTNVCARHYVEKMRIILSFFYFIVVMLGMFGVMIYLWMHNRISTGEVVQVFATMWSLAMILWSVGSALPILFQSFGTVKQAYSVMREANDLGDRPDAQNLKISSGEIVFENVSFHYGENELFVKKHVKIEGGEKVGLVGYTGAGKSTFVNLILRFFPLREGKISIDGQDIAAVSLQSLRNQIALIPQDPVLFHRTLWDNISYGKPQAAKDEVLHAAKLAHCEEFIHSLPKKYDARVGERGTKLSGGEKQRIAIARAILADAPILILDEATSSLDSVTERYIQESLEKLMEKRTTIVIAHRLSTLSRMDRIIVFDKGKIVEEGSHDSLLQQEGLYSKMWKMQVGGFLPKDPIT